MPRYPRHRAMGVVPYNDPNLGPFWPRVKEIGMQIEIVVKEALKKNHGSMTAVFIVGYEGEEQERAPRIYISVLTPKNHKSDKGMEYALDKLESLNKELEQQGMPRLVVRESEDKIIVAPDWSKVACDEAHATDDKKSFADYFSALQHACIELRSGRHL